MNPSHGHSPDLRATQHDCVGACDIEIAGHGLSPMRVRLASATPSRWADAIVLEVSPQGWIEVALVSTGATVLLWNHADLTATISTSDPVALHRDYDVLAVGGSRHHVVTSNLP